MVLGNPQFLRPCHGVPVSGGRRLHYYAADVGRAPDGSWWVLKDRCESPVGGGYALENRIALRNCLPDEFVASRVQQLAGFFQSVHEGHVRAGPARTDPRIIVLTAGPTTSGYFAHSYLARYQGYVLAEGRRPHGARQPRLPEDARGPASGGRDHPARGGRLLRSTGASQ